MTPAIPPCNEVVGGSCPPLREWPEKSLIIGCCPRCGSPDEKAWRELRARRLTAASTPTRPSEEDA